MIKWVEHRKIMKSWRDYSTQMWRYDIQHEACGTKHGEIHVVKSILTSTANTSDENSTELWYSTITIATSTRTHTLGRYSRGDSARWGTRCCFRCSTQGHWHLVTTLSSLNMNDLPHGYLMMSRGRLGQILVRRGNEHSSFEVQCKSPSAVNRAFRRRMPFQRTPSWNWVMLCRSTFVVCATSSIPRSSTLLALVSCTLLFRQRILWNKNVMREIVHVQAGQCGNQVRPLGFSFTLSLLRDVDIDIWDQVISLQVMWPCLKEVEIQGVSRGSP